MNPFDHYDLARVRFERNPRLCELEAEAALDKRRSEESRLERAAFLFHCLAGIGTIEWQRNFLTKRNLLCVIGGFVLTAAFWANCRGTGIVPAAGRVVPPHQSRRGSRMLQS